MASKGEPIPMMTQIESFLDKIPIMQQLEDKTQIDKKALAAGVALVLLLVVLFGFGASVLSMLVGFIYPAFSSFKALEEQHNDRQRFWLVYWVVYACFLVAETFLEPILYFVPFYTPIKLMFLVYLFYPSTKGALTIYDNVLRDLIKPYVQAIDDKLDDMKDAADALGAKVTGAAASVVGEGVALAGQETKKQD